MDRAAYWLHCCGARSPTCQKITFWQVKFFFSHLRSARMLDQGREEGQAKRRAQQKELPDLILDNAGTKLKK